MINFHDPEEPEFVGNIAVDNPWEFIHKVRAGQPGSNPPMPSSIDSGWSLQDVVDVLAYAQTLPTVPPPPGSVSRGGLLYDKWWKVVELDEPTEDNPIWARQDTNTRSGDDTWRCKECHGWDYKGSEGAYGSGSHFTGFPGVFNAQENEFDALMAQLTGGIDPEHDYSAMGEDALTDLVSFLRAGLVDMAQFIDADTKAAIGGDAANGEDLYMAACTACHGEDGRMINFHDPDDPEFVGNIAVDNPWEFIHKVRAGQPGSAMPSAIANGWSMQDVIDVLTFAQGLPTEAP
jgi:thiosulfate dehydrogenase